MRLLLDTHAFLWWTGDDHRLGPAARSAISDPENVVYVSAASAWEISIKRAKGKLRTSRDLEAAIAEHGFRALSIEIRDGIAAGALPTHHRDPFDRMLIAQAQRESMTVVTNDSAFEKYEVDTVPAAR